MLGRGNTPAVYDWFGQGVSIGIPLALENYALLRRLWAGTNVDWEGRFRTPLHGFTSVPRPLDGTPPFVWHGSVQSPEIAEQAAAYGDGFLVNNLFAPTEQFLPLVHHYRERYQDHGHGLAADAVVGAAGAACVRPSSQDAIREFEPYFRASPLGRSGSLAHSSARTGLTVGSPAEVVEKVLRTVEVFGRYHRQLFAIDLAGLLSASFTSSSTCWAPTSFPRCVASRRWCGLHPPGASARRPSNARGTLRSTERPDVRSADRPQHGSAVPRYGYGPHG